VIWGRTELIVGARFLCLFLRMRKKIGKVAIENQAINERY